MVGFHRRGEWRLDKPGLEGTEVVLLLLLLLLPVGVAGAVAFAAEVVAVTSAVAEESLRRRADDAEVVAVPGFFTDLSSATAISCSCW